MISITCEFRMSTTFSLIKPARHLFPGAKHSRVGWRHQVSARQTNLFLGQSCVIRRAFRCTDGAAEYPKFQWRRSSLVRLSRPLSVPSTQSRSRVVDARGAPTLSASTRRISSQRPFENRVVGAPDAGAGASARDLTPAPVG